MFVNQRRGTAGLGSIGAVAAVIFLWLLSTGVMVKSYREGAHSKLPANSTCEVICQGVAVKG